MLNCNTNSDVAPDSQTRLASERYVVTALEWNSVTGELRDAQVANN